MSNSGKKLTLNTKGTEIHWDDTFRLMSWWQPDIVANAKVMVVGAGALGNEVLKNLALMNIGHILIVDFDTIEYANLCRSILYREKDSKSGKFKSQIAADRIKEINPNIEVQFINGDIMVDVGLGVFRRMNVIFGCLDNRIARLFINRYAFKVGKIWIDGAIENLSGQLTVYQPEKSCYECRLTEQDWNNIRIKLGCADIAKRNSSVGRVPTTPISSSIIAAMQVQEGLKVIHGMDKKLMSGEQFKYDGLNNWMFTFGLEELKEECDSHYSIPDGDILESPLSYKSTVGETLDWLQQHFKQEVKILLNYKIILEITTLRTEKSFDVIIPEPHFSEEMQISYQVEAGEDLGFTKSISVVDSSFPDKSLSLHSIGIPFLHIITVETSDDICFVELSGDDHLLFNLK